MVAVVFLPGHEVLARSALSVLAISPDVWDTLGSFLTERDETPDLPFPNELDQPYEVLTTFLANLRARHMDILPEGSKPELLATCATALFHRSLPWPMEAQLFFISQEGRETFLRRIEAEPGWNVICASADPTSALDIFPADWDTRLGE